jgi:hypothetical protein
MPNKRDLKLDEYDIGTFAYRELNNFCKQYRDKKRRMRELQNPYKSPQITGMPSGSGPGDPTGRMAERAAILSNDIDMIERAAKEASPSEFELFLLAMTEDVSWDYMRILKDLKMGRDKFNNRRRHFYYILAQKKGIV